MFTTDYPHFNMVKRSCPFNDDMNPQMKIHVSSKEVAAGVMGDQHMKLVYDKTKDLLFLGAKRTSAAQCLESSALVNGSKANSALPSSNVCGVAPLKQMQLTCQGQLSSSKQTLVLPPSKKVSCSKCSVQHTSEICSCSFCDTPMCPSCIQICIKCQDNFCSSCSFNVYDATEGYICRNCC